MTSKFEKYHQLRNQVDQLSEQLSSLHKSHMACKKGCDLCCMDYDVFPIEFEAMKEALQNKQVDVQKSVDGSCIFLKDHTCQIYEHRPIICRTHGLPLLFMNDDQWELSACELNFTEFDDEEFNTENTFPQDKFNSKLFLLNQAFLKENDLPYSDFDLIPIQKLKG
ncbi:YkgJ family cysteine cluster protein [uncultured Sunxiuqinia sp.]|uniref:YkgJ family cysteine cluster protein n=1 Tax=Sunxiuqinia rutila TaxID=1397841 RepID=UPI002621E33F|nr:YkgJ family cysteine cluster protein [uncultured Sunxiuqinia sp.]